MKAYWILTLEKWADKSLSDQDWQHSIIFESKEIAKKGLDQMIAKANKDAAYEEFRQNRICAGFGDPGPKEPTLEVEDLSTGDTFDYILWAKHRPCYIATIKPSPVIVGLSPEDACAVPLSVFMQNEHLWKPGSGFELLG